MEGDGAWLVEAKTYQASWVLKIVGFNLCCELILCNFWHWMTYANQSNAEALKPFQKAVSALCERNAPIELLGWSGVRVMKVFLFNFFLSMLWL